jgi:hypothetical protein
VSSEVESTGSVGKNRRSFAGFWAVSIKLAGSSSCEAFAGRAVWNKPVTSIQANGGLA